MASSGVECYVCAYESSSSQSGRHLDNSVFEKICDSCSAAFTDGTFCIKFHRYVMGWVKCNTCETQLHCGCLMSLNSFAVSDIWGVICTECANRPTSLAFSAGASSSDPDPFDFRRLNVTDIAADFTGPQLLVGRGRSVNNAPQIPLQGLTFAFEKRLTPSDCNPITARLLLPKRDAEEYLPMPEGQNKMPVSMKDVRGRTWNFNLHWWPHKNSRKYILDRTRGCMMEMGWNVGDTLKFYTGFADGGLVMEHEKFHCLASFPWRV